VCRGYVHARSGAAMELLDEGSSKDQGLDFVAFYPTEECLVKMLYRSGFPFVYLFQRLPEHALYRQSGSPQTRTHDDGCVETCR